MMKPCFCAVLDMRPCLDSADGFAPRAFHFLEAVSRKWDLEVIAIRREGDDWESDNFLPKAIRGHVTIEDVGQNPLLEPGLRGKMQRARHYLLPERLSRAHPLHLRSLPAVLSERNPEAVAFFLPHLAHLGAQLPAGALPIYVLEEGLERSIGLVLNTARKWKSAWIQVTERRAANRLYKQLARRRGLIIAISEAEKEWFARYIPQDRIAVIPHGIDCDYFAPTPREPDFDIMICGVLSHRRNYEPLLQLFKIVEERLQNSSLRPRWLLVGKNPPQEVAALQNERVMVTGSVPDVRPYYDRARIVVVPAFEGCGVKTTVLQGWAMKRAVVATAFAANGLPIRPGENVVIAQTEQDLAGQIIALLSQPSLQEKLADAGWQTAQSERNMEVLGERFVEAVAAAQVAHDGGSSAPS